MAEHGRPGNGLAGHGTLGNGTLGNGTVQPPFGGDGDQGPPDDGPPAAFGGTGTTTPRAWLPPQPTPWFPEPSSPAQPPA